MERAPLYRRGLPRRKPAQPPMTSSSPRPAGLRQLLTSSAWLAVAAILGQGSMVVAGILVARALGVQNYGRFTLMQATLVMLAGVAQLSFSVVISQQVAKYRDADPAATGRIASFCFLFTLSMGAMLAAALAIGQGFLARQVFRDPALAPAITVIAAILPMVAVSAVQQGLFNGLARFRAQAWIALAMVPLVVGSPYFGAREYGLLGALGGLALAFAGRFVLSQAVLFRVFRQEGIGWSFGISPERATRLLGLAGPATLAGIVVSFAVWGGQALLALCAHLLGQVGQACGLVSREKRQNLLLSRNGQHHGGSDESKLSIAGVMRLL